MENRNGVDELFRKGFENFEAQTPYDALIGIQERVRAEKKKKRIVLWRRSAILLGLLFAFYTGYYFNNYQNQILPSNTNLPNTPVNQNSTPIVNNEDPTTSEDVYTSKITLDSLEIVKNTEANPSKLLPAQQIPSNSKQRNLTLSPAAQELPGATNAATNTATTASADKDVPFTNVFPKTLQSPYFSLIRKTEALKTPQYVLLESEPDLGLFKPKKQLLKRTYSVGAYGAFIQPFRTVVYDETNEVTSNNVSNEQLENTYSFGFKLTKRVGLLEYHVGLFSSSWNQTSNNIILEGDPVNNTIQTYTNNIAGYTSIGDLNFGVASGPPVEPAVKNGQYFLIPNISQQYQFLDIPIGASYYFYDKRVKLKFTFALNSRILTQSQVILEYPNGLQEDYDGLKPRSFTLQMLLGPAIGYSITPRLQWHLDPTLNYGLSPIHNADGIKTYQHHFGFFTGLSYVL